MQIHRKIGIIVVYIYRKVFIGLEVAMQKTQLQNIIRTAILVISSLVIWMFINMIICYLCLETHADIHDFIIV